MFSNKKARFIISLQKKKIREEQKTFIIEGDKIVKEFLLAGMPVRTLVARSEFIAGLPEEVLSGITSVEPVSYEELKKISSLKTPHNALATVSMPETKTDPINIINEVCVALDFIQDPGNLGTIIRAAAWFGIQNIICSDDCVDMFNPKAIQASMGAILNVKVHYYDLKQFLNIASEKNIPVYGTFPEGKSIYSQKLDNKGIILLGNESKGISEDLFHFITCKLMIPKFSNAVHGIDSLNVGMAASVIFSEFARRKKRDSPAVRM